jgi:hypothetical protein
MSATSSPPAAAQTPEHSNGMKHNGDHSADGKERPVALTQADLVSAGSAELKKVLLTII